MLPTGEGWDNPELLMGWKYLYNTRVGQSMATFIAEDGVSIKPSKEKYNYAEAADVLDENRRIAEFRPGGTIYILPKYEQDPVALAGKLAHEARHIRPIPMYRQVGYYEASIQEEYFAYQLELLVYQEIVDKGWTYNDKTQVKKLYSLEESLMPFYPYMELTDDNLETFRAALGPLYKPFPLYPNSP